MVRLDGQDAGGAREVARIPDQGRGAVVGGDADILEDVGCQQEVGLVGERIEAVVRAGEAGGAGREGEGEVEVDGGRATALLPRAARRVLTWARSLRAISLA